MTFEKLKELIEKYNIPNDVELLSDIGTDMNGVFYNSKENHIIFTQDVEYSYSYLEDEDYITLD